ncbi:MAG: tetratricopeptide repeat protein [Gemmatales bacterium]
MRSVQHNLWQCGRLLVCMIVLTSPAQAGIHISTEKLAPVAELSEFPAQLRFLRGYGPPDVTMGSKPTTQRLDFLAKVEALRAKGKLTPDEIADLGGYLIYLKLTSPKQPPFEEAVSVMEPAMRANPRHFALAANLGTAYQLTGRLDAAERCLQTAVDLAPAPLRDMEQLQLRLVQRRLRENLTRGAQPDLDLLFGKAAAPFRFVDARGNWNYGDLAAGELDKLPNKSAADTTRQIQQLLIWLPDDGRLHWQLAEWSLVMKNPKLALELFRDAVDTFRLSHPNLKQRRALVQEAMHWRSLVGSFGNKRQPEVWIVQTLGQSLVPFMTSDSLSQALVEVSSAMPAKQKLFLGNDALMGDNPAQAKPEVPFVLQPWHWVLIVLGSMLAVFMLYWQLNEWFTRLTRSRKSA